jgi:hypothetical protein
VLILGLIAFLVLLILKIGPIFMNHDKVLNAFSTVENTADLETKTQYEIQQSLSKYFNLNFVDLLPLRM